MRTRAVEDFLKAVYDLRDPEGRVRTSALAERLRLSAGSVTEMAKRLAGERPRLVTHRHHRGVGLMADGERVALDVIRRHRLLETFLHQVLGFGWDEVHEEAERLEHCLSDRLTDAIDAYLDHPAADPHGDPIPRTGEVPEPEERAGLDAIPKGRTVRIARVRRSEPDLLRYLAETGITLHAEIQITEQAPFGGPVSFRSGEGGPVRAIGRDVARDILVEPA
ncbi:MAG: metal-dependent transcriptional regulator [Desulfococcaceae bacterium]